MSEPYEPTHIKTRRFKFNAIVALGSLGILGLVAWVGWLLWGGDEPARDPSCCKVCTDSKPCGDTCIAADETCHVDKGCACTD